MRRWFFPLLLALCLSSASAEIPLVLEATIQLPSAGGWDVQHWMSDSTFGWACVSGDTILFVEQLGDSPRSYEIPDSAFDPFYSIHHDDVKLLRLSSQPAAAFAVLTTNGINTDDPSHTYGVLYFSLVNLPAGQLVGSFALGGYGSNAWGMGAYVYYRSIGVLLPWPCPPAFSSSLTTTWLSEEDYWHEGSNGSCSSTETYGRIHISNLSTGFSPNSVIAGTDVSIFAGSNPVRFAMAGGHSLHDYCQEVYFDSCWVNRYDAAQGLGVANYALGCVTVLAQQDADSTERMIIYDNSGVRALNPESYSVYWQSSAITGTLYTARLAGSADERLLAYQDQSQRFRVYDASDGSYLDQTSPISGTIDHLIKRVGYDTEIVTYDSTAHVVRVYGSAPAVPGGLTCYFIPQSNVVRLRWQAVAGAQGYRVYAAASADGEQVLVTELPAGSVSYDLAPQEERQFFYVTAVYAAR